MMLCKACADGRPETCSKLVVTCVKMAALLLDIEWADGDERSGWCAFCGRNRDEGHAHDCRYAAVLREAGVLGQNRCEGCGWHPSVHPCVCPDRRR